MPEEFTGWIETTTAELTDHMEAVVAQVEGTVARVRDLDRKAVAAAIAGHPHRGLVFAALDGKPFLAQAWAAVRPVAERALRAQSQDVA